MSEAKVVERHEIPVRYKSQIALSDHSIIRDEDGTYRYKRNRLVVYLFMKSGLDVNHLVDLAENEMVSAEELMQFYRDKGYTLCGFEEIFAGKTYDI